MSLEGLSSVPRSCLWAETPRSPLPDCPSLPSGAPAWPVPPCTCTRTLARIYGAPSDFFPSWLSPVFFPLTLSPYLPSLSIALLPTPFSCSFNVFLLTQCILLTWALTHITFSSTLSYFLSLSLVPPFLLCSLFCLSCSESHTKHPLS